MHTMFFSLMGVGKWIFLIFLLYGIAQGQTSDQQLAEKFKPILILDSGDNDQSPKQVEIVGAHQWQNIYFRKVIPPGSSSEISAPDMINEVGYVPGVNTTTGNFSAIEPAYEIGGAIYQPHFDFGGPNVNGSEHDGHTPPGWETIYNQVKNNYVDRIYARVFDHPIDPPAFPQKAVIQYWFFYPYNDWWNNHEGDWEHINVIVSSRSPATAQADTIEYYFHGEFTKRKVVSYTEDTIENPLQFQQGQGTPEYDKVALVKGTRPVIYVGGWGNFSGPIANGSGPSGHGSFPTPGAWYFNLAINYAFSAGITDNPDGKGRIVYDATLVTLNHPNEYNYNVNPEMSWLKANIKWGALKVDSPLGLGNDAPEGPAYKSTWEKTGSMAGTPYYTHTPPNMVYQHHFVMENTTWRDEVELIGDIVIYPGAHLTIAPGTTIRFKANSDIHKISQVQGTSFTNDPSRIEIMIAPGGTLTADATGGPPIVFKSNAGNPMTADWGGIRNKGTMVLRNCILRDAFHAVETGGGDIIEHCEFVNNTMAVVGHGSQNVTIAYNTVRNSANHGLFLLNAAYNVHNNLIHNNGWRGIALGQDQGSVLRNNTIANNTGAGVHIGYAASPTTILNSLITHNGQHGIVVDGGLPPFVRHSIVTGNTGGEFGLDIASWSNPPNNVFGNEGNLVGDPLYVNAGNQDYALQVTSPGIDAGWPTGIDPVEGNVINMGHHGGTEDATHKPSALLLVENFNDNNAKDGVPVTWIDHVAGGQWATWKVKGQGSPYYGAHVLENSSQGVDRTYVNLDRTGYILDVDIKFDAEEGKVIYSQAHQDERYRLDLMHNWQTLRLMIDDVPYYYGMSINRNQWYHITIEAVSGSHVKVYVNGFLTHNQSTGKTFDGRMGAGSYSGGWDRCTFDNFTVMQIGGGGGGGGGGGIVNGNFSDGLNGWTATGPWRINGAWTTYHGYTQPGQIGDFAGSYPQESDKGTLTSTPFTIDKPYLNFRIGGQDNANANKVRLFVGGQPVKEVGPPQDNGFVDVSWSVSNWNGQTGYIECEDNNGNDSYAWFCVDEFHLSDTPTTTPSKPVVRAGDGPAFRSDLPDTFFVAQNVPNPFNPQTTIGYALPRASEVKLVIYNVLGQEVRRLIDGRVGAGRHQVVWDARDDLGRAVSSGLYFYRFTAGPVDEVKKMLILK